MNATTSLPLRWHCLWLNHLNHFNECPFVLRHIVGAIRACLLNLSSTSQNQSYFPFFLLQFLFFSVFFRLFCAFFSAFGKSLIKAFSISQPGPAPAPPQPASPPGL